MIRLFNSLLIVCMFIAFLLISAFVMAITIVFATLTLQFKTIPRVWAHVVDNVTRLWNAYDVLLKSPNKKVDGGR